MGHVSKAMLENIIASVTEVTKLHQWRNTATVIDWFKNIKHKKHCRFIKFDICEFYPSITEALLDKAIEFARASSSITDIELNVIKHSRKSLLFNNSEAWIKKESDLFDVTMGSFDGAEVCELVGLYLLDQLSHLTGKDNTGLYRDDGLAAIRCSSARRFDVLRKDITEFFEQFFCVNCIAENIAFSTLNSNEFITSVQKGVINSNENTSDFIPSDFQQNIFDKLNSAINNNAFDLDTDEGEDGEVMPTIDCKYYSIHDFSSANFSPNRSFSILHYNIHSIEKHIEQFRLDLALLDFTFDIICISESKIIKDCDPKVDINILGYKTPVGTPTESTKGGVLIYVKDTLNFKPRNDLKIYKARELESIFIEIINEKESNDIVGVVYRHPCMDPNEFIDDHLKDIADKISFENKKVFIAGDFNFDLLNVSAHHETFDFFDNMMSNFLLPVITLPTKINRGKNTLIDNIFTNHLHPDTKSGNLEINLSDGHLPSFMVTPRQNQNHLPKKHNIFARNSKNFNKDTFIRD